jgi:hypothetical protein|tara:strand:+ start:8774 stop:9301 length:528 start_codon:yes stop_codon:yes gene_type:complete
MANIKDYKYKLIKNFFSKEELEILKPYCLNRLDEDWTTDPQSPHAPNFTDDALMKVFHEKKHKLVEELSGLKLFRTYSYWRYYMYGSDLETHTDRPACEVSITVSIHQTKKWPIHMNNNWIDMEEGDAVIYLGYDIPHGRKTFKHDGCAQVFFHFVDKDGPYTDHKNDQVRKNSK